MSISTPTLMNDTIRWTVPALDRSIMNSFTTTIAIRAAPASQTTRTPCRVATTMLASATSVQRIKKAVWTTSERTIVSRANGTPAQWCSARSRTAFAHTNVKAASSPYACARGTAATGCSASRRPSTNQSAIASTAPISARSSGFRIGTYGSGDGSPLDTKFTKRVQTSRKTASGVAPATRYASRCAADPPRDPPSEQDMGDDPFGLGDGCALPVEIPRAEQARDCEEHTAEIAAVRDRE